MIECQAQGCPAVGRHYVENPTTRMPFHLCGKHANDHALGFGFELDTYIRLVKDEPAAGGLTPAQVQSIVITTEQGTYTLKPKEANMAYSALDRLNDAQSEAQSAIDEIEERLSELNDAREQLQDMLDNIAQAISVLEELDSFSVSVDVDSLSVDVSLYL